MSLGTGVMIGAGIFALTGQVAELAGEWFPLAFLGAAVVAAFSAYSYIKVSNAYPSAGGIANLLQRAYGKTTLTGAFALLMYFSMVINESLVARTFGTYTLQLFDGVDDDWRVPALGVGLLAFAFLVNLMGNRFIERLSFVMAVFKIAGVALFALAGLWVSGWGAGRLLEAPPPVAGGGFLEGVALALLAYKGFTTITNSGAEIVAPHRNVGRAIMIAIGLCLVLYLLVTLAVGANLGIGEIVRARDYALAEAARPAFGGYGLWFTVSFAIVASLSGVIASVFAVSRMLAMLTDMQLAPYSRLGVPGGRQRHTLLYTVVIAMLFTVFFDLGRIASLGAIFYIVMDMAVHWGVLRHLRREVGARAGILVVSLLLDALVLAALVWGKARSDAPVVYAALAGLALVFFAEWLFVRSRHAAKEA